MKAPSRRLGLYLACAALLGAIAHPQISVERRTLNVIAIVDITQSMNVVDEFADGRQVSRLEFVKIALRQAVDRLPCGSKLGLGIFTQYRSLVMLMPVETCASRRDLDDAIEGIDVRMGWAGGSEIAKGVYLTLRMLKTLEAPPAFAFLTDGHEAPPINPRHRIDITGVAGSVPGLLIGVGGSTAAPIPKVDPDGNPAGFWGAHDVMQEDVYAHGRQGNVANEMMDESGPSGPAPAALLGTPGFEHLSALRESYLEAIAGEARLRYAHLTSEMALADLLGAAQLGRPEKVAVDIRWLGGMVALAALTVPCLVRLFAAARRAQHRWLAVHLFTFWR